MRLTARLATTVLVAASAAGALLVVASLHGAILGEKLIGGSLTDGMRRNAAIYAVLLAAASVVLARLAVAAWRLACGRVPARPRRRLPPVVRLAAGLVGPVAAVAGLWVSLLAVIFTAAWSRPDPAVPDGDPCCGHPDTWADVAVGTVYALTTGFVAVMLVAGGAILLASAATGRLPALAARPGVLGAAALAVGLAAAVPASWMVSALLAGDYP